LQKFIGQADWDHRPLLAELARQVGAELGEADGVLVFDPSAFPKKGTESVGVQRQWCGRLGKVDNCQVGVYLGYVSRGEHALVDVRLYLPREWARDRQRRRKAGVPKGVRFRTRHELALGMLDERGPSLPHGWVAGDGEMGRCSWFRGELRSRGECYLLAVPSNTAVRDLTAPDPPYAGHGPRPRVPFVRVDRWCAALPETAWQTVEVREGEKGPLAVQAAWGLVQARTEGRPSDVAEVLVVFRERQRDGAWKHDYLLSNASLTTPLEEFARVYKAGHRIEECLKRAKREAGLGDYQVRTWEGWHHHQALSLLAAWFLTPETRRGKRRTPALTVPQVRQAIGRMLNRLLGCDRPSHVRRTMRRHLRRNEEARLYHWKRHNRLPPRRVEQRSRRHFQGGFPRRHAWEGAAEAADWEGGQVDLASCVRRLRHDADRLGAGESASVPCGPCTFGLA
jgi:SRSO17 transposase